MNDLLKHLRIGFAVFALLITTDPRADIVSTPNSLRALMFDQKLDNQLPLDLSFNDEAGRKITLGQCLGSGPVILALGYYQCPMLCNLVLNGIVESLQEIKPSADHGARLIFVSIDPKEAASLADAKRKTYLKRFGRRGAEARWHFLTGDEPSIRTLAAQVGFHYAYDPIHHEYAHPSGIVILTPVGKVARYFFGVSYPAAELESALASAATNHTSSPVRELFILCSRFVPLTGKFSGLVMGAVRAVAVMTVLLVAGLAFWRQRRKAGFSGHESEMAKGTPGSVV
jgi:protein SCO1/2